MKYKDIILKELNTAKIVLNDFMDNFNAISSIERAAKMLSNAFRSNNKVITCGNGGSYCDAMHFAEELTGFYRKNRVGYPAISISDGGYISCVSNDFGYKYIFSRYIETVGKQNDIVVVFSTSGNSKNIVNAVESAKKNNMKIIAISGKNGGKIKNIADIEIRVPYLRYSDRIQEMHIKIIHIMVLLIEIEMSSVV